jgi:gamma-glutamylcysteine synthetase
MYISRKTSLSQRELGLLDTGEIFLSTNPGTQIELAGYPWGTISNSPGTLNAVVGQVVPSGALVRGLPEA